MQVDSPLSPLSGIPSSPDVSMPQPVVPETPTPAPDNPHTPTDPQLGATPAGDSPAGVGKQPDALGQGDTSPSSGSLADGSHGDTGAAGSPHVGGTGGQGHPSSTLATRFAATSTCLGHMNQPLASARQVVF